jgi:hypothetical protein
MAATAGGDMGGRHGYAKLEVARPAPDPRRPCDHIDVESLDATAARRIAELVADAGVRIVAVSCYDNLLDPEPPVTPSANISSRAATRPDALGPISWECSSAHPQRTVHDDLTVASDLLPALADVARRRDVTLIVENCPMTVSHRTGSRATSPSRRSRDAGWPTWDRARLRPSRLPSIGIDRWQPCVTTVGPRRSSQGRRGVPRRAEPPEVQLSSGGVRAGLDRHLEAGCRVKYAHRAGTSFLAHHTVPADELDLLWHRAAADREPRAAKRPCGQRRRLPLTS